MSLERNHRATTDKAAGKRREDALVSPDNSTARAHYAYEVRSPSASSSSHSSRFSAQTRLRYRKLIPPITPTELEPVIPGGLGNNDDIEEEDEAHDKPSMPKLRYPRVELSSLDLAKPRIYTRILYFFESGQTTTTTTTTRPSSPLGTFGYDQQSSNRQRHEQQRQEQQQQQQQRQEHPHEHDGEKKAQKSVWSPSPSSNPSTSASSSPSRQREPRSNKSKQHHHYHYNQADFMDPMLLQASLALVLTDFFPLAGRLLANHAGPGSKPYIECNDRGVLFAVADTTTTMQQIRKGDFQDAVLPPQLHTVGLYPASLRDPPLLSIQLTYTPDKSLIMGVAMDSSVMDGKSLVSFMDAWSSITQGKDFSPYPILDRTFLEQYSFDSNKGSGNAPSQSAIYRHQRINDSPPPPILFDNNLDNVDDGLDDSDPATEDECGPHNGDHESDDSGTSESEHDEDDDDDEVEDEAEIGSRFSRPNRMMDDVPRVTIGQHHGALEEAPTDLPEISQEPEGGSLHLFHFSGAQLERIKKLASEQNIAAAACAAQDKEISDKWVSTGDALIAYLWKMTTITRRMDPECKLMCGVIMDIRDRLVPPIPEGFIGNAILSIFVQMPVHSLLTTPLSLPSRLLRDELQLQTSDQIRSAMTWIQRQVNPHLIEPNSNNPFGLDFMVWSFRKLDLYKADFGRGGPCKVRIGRGGFGGGEGMCIIMDGPSASSPSSSLSSSLSSSSQQSSQAKGVGVGVGVGTSAAAQLIDTSGNDIGAHDSCGDGGVDVYLGIQGEHLQDFEKVHNEFMDGLLESNVEEWQVL